MTQWIKEEHDTYDGYDSHGARRAELWMVEPPRPRHACLIPHEYIKNHSVETGPDLIALRERTYWCCPECGRWWWLHPTGGMFDTGRWFTLPAKRPRWFGKDVQRAWDDIEELKQLNSQEET